MLLQTVVPDRLITSSYFTAQPVSWMHSDRHLKVLYVHLHQLTPPLHPALMRVVLPATETRLITHWKPSRRPRGIRSQNSLNLTVTPSLDPHHPLFKSLGPNSLSRYPYNLLTNSNRKMDTLFTTSKPKPQTQVFIPASATRLEIVFLALGILSLVALLLLILALAVRRRVSASINKRHHRRSHRPDIHDPVSSPCLFNSTFGGPLPHEPLLSSSSSLPADDNEANMKTSLLNRVRKASEHLAEAVQYELMQLGRRVSAHGRAVVGATTRRGQTEQERRVRDEEVGLDAAQQQHQNGFDGWRDQDNSNWSWDTEACTVGPKPETVMQRPISWVTDQSRRSSYAYSRGLASPCNTGQVFRARVISTGGRWRSLAVTGAEYAV